jgi:hypothetical protein
MAVVGFQCGAFQKNAFQTCKGTKGGDVGGGGGHKKRSRRLIELWEPPSDKINEFNQLLENALRPQPKPVLEEVVTETVPEALEVKVVDLQEVRRQRLLRNLKVFAALVLLNEQN